MKRQIRGRLERLSIVTEGEIENLSSGRWHRRGEVIHNGWL